MFETLIAERKCNILNGILKITRSKGLKSQDLFANNRQIVTKILGQQLNKS